jgi:hypothetical protein
LDFITSPHTSVAIDTLGQVHGHVRMTQVFGSVKMIFTFWIPNISDSHSCSDGLEFTIIIDFARQTIERMISQYKLYDIFS